MTRMQDRQREWREIRDKRARAREDVYAVFAIISWFLVMGFLGYILAIQ